MDHTAARKRPRSARVRKYLPYDAHQVGYQRFRAISGAQVLRCSAFIYQDRNGFSGHLILGCGLPICCQNRVEAQTKDAAIWAWETLTTKARKGWPQPTEKRTVSGQLVQATIK